MLIELLKPILGIALHHQRLLMLATLSSPNDTIGPQVTGGRGIQTRTLWLGSQDTY